jgi:competence protein ComEC
MSTAFFYVPPDLFISGDGKHVAVRLSDGRMAMVKGRTGNLTSQQWARAATELELAGKEEAPMQCDKKGCIVHAGKRMIAILHDADALADDCQMADIVIVTEPVARDVCAAPVLIDKTMLDAGGAVAVWFEGGKVTVKQVRTEQGNRPWVTQEAAEQGEE